MLLAPIAHALHPHVEYLRYVARHKRHVYAAGVRLGVPRWRLIVHDWTKLLPAEWLPYVKQFYGPDAQKVREAYYHNPNDGHSAFNRAWVGHCHHNRHHWQHWVVVLESSDRVPQRACRRGWSGCVPSGWGTAVRSAVADAVHMTATRTSAYMLTSGVRWCGACCWNVPHADGEGT